MLISSQGPAHLNGTRHLWIHKYFPWLNPSCCDTGAILKLSQFVRIMFHGQRKYEILERELTAFKASSSFAWNPRLFASLKKNEALRAEKGELSCMVVKFLIRGLFKKYPRRIYSENGYQINVTSLRMLYYFLLFPHNCVSLSRDNFTGGQQRFHRIYFKLYSSHSITTEIEDKSCIAQNASVKLGQHRRTAFQKLSFFHFTASS